MSKAPNGCANEGSVLIWWASENAHAYAYSAVHANVMETTAPEWVRVRTTTDPEVMCSTYERRADAYESA